MTISRRTVLGALATGAVAGGLSAPLASAKPTNPSKPRTLRVLALNIWFGGTVVADGKQQVADIIAGTDADIVLLSESGETTEQLIDLLAERGLTFFAASSGDTGILSRFPIAESTVLPFMTKAVINVGPRTVVAYAAHLEYRWYATYLPRGYGAGVPEPGRFSEYGWDKIPTGPVLDLPAILQTNLDSGRPAVIEGFLADAAEEQAKGRSIILGGDFNEPSVLDWTAATKNLYDHHGLVIPWQSTTLLQTAGYVDAYRTVYPDAARYSGATWPSDNPAVPVDWLTWAPEADERDRIDYIFASPTPGLKLLDAGVVGPVTTIVNSERVPEPRPDDFRYIPEQWPTDHKGVLAVYRLAGAPEKKNR